MALSADLSKDGRTLVAGDWGNVFYFCFSHDFRD